MGEQQQSTRVACSLLAWCDSRLLLCRLVAVLERVQGGIIGQTLSRYGVAGLYTVVVLSVGAFWGLVARTLCFVRS